MRYLRVSSMQRRGEEGNGKFGRESGRNGHSGEGSDDG